MADQPETTDETTPTNDDNDHLVHPDGMNPHIVPENTSDEDDSVHTDSMNPHVAPEQASGE
ncbi:hypothetical protein OG417_00145 [Actinoallomurus sp. NBC_01490]|uniref:hypothetical protein n=1 Tax=Actinoallomurus sp. NBC_01490 TaxID=2903557 RepID=UPI002E2FC427|nr:hypothetical protein [Actinoallomurus sp. NBC_01490]